MNWIDLNTEALLSQAEEASMQNPQIIFKHSPRCPISKAAYNRVEAMDKSAWYVDVFKSRDISNLIAEKFDVKHESPQVLIMNKGKIVSDADHRHVTVEFIEESLQNLN